MPSPRFSRSAFWPYVLTAFLFLFFAAVLLSAVRSTPLLFDVSLHAIVARNVATGYGWAMSYASRELLLTISTGPTVILPAAAVVALLGNTLWVPALSAVLIHVLLLAVLLWQLRKFCTAPWQLPALSLGLLFLFLHFESLWWTLLIGEISAWLLFLIACTVAADPGIHSERRRYLLIGALASLSLLARMISLPAFAGLGMYLLWREWQALQTGKRHAWASLQLLLWGLTGLLLTSLPFRLYEAAHFLSSDTLSYWDNLRYRWDLYQNNSATGIGKLAQSDSLWTAAAHNASTNYRILAKLLSSYGITTGVLCLLIICTILVLVAHALRARQAWDRLIAMLYLSTFFYAIWYFFVCQTGGFDRYALLPLLTLFVLLMFLLLRHTGPIGIALLIIAAVWAAPAPRLQLMQQLLGFQTVAWLDGNAQTYNQLTLEAANYLENTPSPYPLANCGWMGTTRELEYLLPQPENFRNCFDMINAALEPNPDTGDYRWRHPVSFTLVINQISWRMAKSHKPSALRHRYLMQACRPQTRFDNRLYRIMDCPFDALQTAIPLDPDTPFIGQLELLEQRPLSQAHPNAK